MMPGLEKRSVPGVIGRKCHGRRTGNPLASVEMMVMLTRELERNYELAYQDDVNEEVCVASTLEKYANGREDDSEDNLSE